MQAMTSICPLSIARTVKNKEKRWFSACALGKNVVYGTQSPGEGKTGGCRPVKKTGKSMFNLIEITMAIAVVGIGIAAIMALFPPALEANRVANTENYIGGIVETLQSFTENYVRQNWSKITDFPDTEKSPATEASFPPAWTAVTGFPGLYNVDTANGIYGILSDDKTICMHLKIWRDATPPVIANTALATSSNSARLFIELSWPVILPYANREKRFYVFELYEGN